MLAMSSQLGERFLSESIKMDADGSGFVNIIDLALLFGYWFSAVLLLIVVYGLFDIIDRRQRAEDERNRNEEMMLVSVSDMEEGNDVSDMEEVNDELDGMVIENGPCEHLNDNVDLIPIIRKQD